MEKIRVMVVGLLGDMATLFANHIEKTEDMKLVPFTLSEETGRIQIGQTAIWQIVLDWHESRLKEIAPDIIVDFTFGSPLDRNVRLYCRCGIPFVVGVVPDTSDSLIIKEVKKSNISAVVAPGRVGVTLKAARFLADRKGKKGAVFYM